jgi:hypothetical protein
MLPRILLLALSLSSFWAAPLGAAAGKAGKKEAAKEAAAEAAKPKTPAKPVEPAAALPVVSPVNAIWHVWKDNQGRTVEAMFCGLSGEFITLQTKDGKTFHFNGNILCQEDIDFAKTCVAKMRESSFSGGSVAKAAADIDRLVLAALEAKGQKPNAPSTDEQFLRRLYIDAVGRVPTAAEATAFLDDRSADKRSKLIDKLVYSPGYSLQMFDWMADLLRVKDTFNKGVPAFTFEDWLKTRIATNAPWDSLVREMLTADGRLCDNGAAGFLLFDAEMPLDGVSNLMTTFLGTNMACAQCHDHPLAEWKQRDFYQMAAFFGATDGKDEGMLAKVRKAIGKDDSIPKAAVRSITNVNAFRLEDTNKQKLTFPKDYKYKDAKPNEAVAPVLIAWEKADQRLPIYKIDVTKPTQLRDHFAQWMTSTQNPRFATNIANRLWKKAFGLAVQEPVNDIDDPKSSSSPELLAHLTQVMKSARFDLREFQRVIYNSKTYQASASASPDLSQGPYLFNGPIIRRLTAEQAWDSLIVNAVGANADNILLRRGDDIKQMALPQGVVSAVAIHQVYDTMKASGMSKGGAAKKAAGGSTAGLANGYDGEKPTSKFNLLLARASELPQPSAETHFLRVFGQGDRLLADSATNDGSVPQVLQLMNGNVGRLVSDLKSHAVVAAYAEKSREAQISSLYLSYLSRRPNPREMAAAGQGLSDGLSLADLAWALANTREFLFIQ